MWEVQSLKEQAVSATRSLPVASYAKLNNEAPNQSLNLFNSPTLRTKDHSINQNRSKPPQASQLRGVHWITQVAMVAAN